VCLTSLLTSHDGVTGSDSQDVGYAENRKITTKSHNAIRSRSHEQDKVCRFGCPCRDYCGRGAESGEEVRSLGTIPNREASIRRLIKKLGPAEQLRACYEAGPTGYVVYWQLAALSVKCEVVAPTLVPVKPGDRVKTDRRDAEKLARSYRSGDLTPVWVPDTVHEALRDSVRAREAAKKDQPAGDCADIGGNHPGRAGKFRASPPPGNSWATAASLPASIPVASGGGEAVSTKTGNAHLRRVVIEAAWAYQHRPRIGQMLHKRQEKLSEEVKEIAWKAQHRLYARYRKHSARGKNKQQVITAMRRELLGFIRFIGMKVEEKWEPTNCAV
jgi:Transposase